jgi:hypothetical protein
MPDRIRALSLLAIAALIPLWLSSCATGSQTWNVTRFHHLDSLADKTYVIVPAKPELVQTLEFGSYAQLVEERLKSHGLVRRPFAELGTADLVFVLEYGANDPKQRVTYYPEYGPIIDRSYPGMTVTQQPLVTAGTVGVSAMTSTSYPTHVQLLVFEGKTLRAGDGTRLYEGLARTDANKSDLTRDVPRGISALLEDFPGKNGTSSAKAFAMKN